MNSIMEVFNTSPILSICRRNILFGCAIYVVAHGTIVLIGKENISNTLRKVALWDQGRDAKFGARAIVEYLHTFKDCFAGVLARSADCVWFVLKVVSIPRPFGTMSNEGKGLDQV